MTKMVVLGSGEQRSLQDSELSRYACYLIVQNVDPEKPIVALGQTYFAVQTCRQELADERLLQGMSEEQRRLFVRSQLTEHNRSLADAAATAGVITARDFAVFQDHGYMGSTELAANLFRAIQTDEKLRREGAQGKNEANATHHAVGRAVRRTIDELGGAMPEDLPTPADSIQQARQQELKRLEQARQPTLFDEANDDE